MAPSSLDDLTNAILEIREDDVPRIVESLLATGIDPSMIIGACREAMSVVGKRFEAGEAFIPELMMAGEMMKTVAAQVGPHLGGRDGSQTFGCVLLGTVKGDIHDIGKDLVGSILEAAGFEVIDLGVDVPPERFVAALEGRDGCTVALSCLLTTGFESMRDTVAAITKAGLRDRVKVMVGGAPVTKQICEYVAADDWGADAATALALAKSWFDGGAQ